MDKKSYFAALKEIRRRYKWLRPDNYEPYLVCANWERIMSPIERIVWGDLRYHGLRFYPQYPAGIYFIDFADPQTMVGIEVDGKEYHQDRKKDKQRQQKFEAMGWIIIRLQGWMTFKDREDYFGELENNRDCYDEEDYQEKWNEFNRLFRSECSEGVLRGVKEKYYSKSYVF